MPLDWHVTLTFPLSPKRSFLLSVAHMKHSGGQHISDKTTRPKLCCLLEKAKDAHASSSPHSGMGGRRDTLSEDVLVPHKYPPVPDMILSKRFSEELWAQLMQEN